MILISLDEGGHFEQITNPQCMLIGGLVFQCRTKQEMDQEKKNLENFFMTVCNEQNCNYPFDLHYNWQDDNVVNTENATKVKSALIAELPDFLRKRGRWVKNKVPGSRYCVFCMVGDQQGLDDRSASNLRDNVATVRYDHMIYRTIENLIFFNPLFLNEKDIHLHLPTRVISTYDASLKQELSHLGYGNLKDNQGHINHSVFSVTNEASFRTCLESALLNSDRNDLIFDLSVLTINYSKPQFNQMFLYLADTLCSVWQDAIQDMTTNEAAVPVLWECGSRLVGSDNTLLWAYHRTDQKWRSCWSSFRHENWFDALRIASDLHTSKSAIDQVYRDIWIVPFENVLIETNNIQALHNALSRLDLYMTDLEKRYQGTGMHIMDILKGNYELLKNENDRGQLQYKISKILTGLYNHRGDYVHARAEYENCVKAARYVPLEEFLGLQLFYSVSLCDARQYDEAKAVAPELVSNHELLNEIRKSVYPDSKTIFDSYARALSQYGQCLAFLGQYDEAIKQFHDAMNIFDKDSTDWRVTGSFLLNALIEKGDQTGYAEVAKEYFCAISIKKQFNAILDRKCGSIPFALYVFLKGLWIFEQNEIAPETVKEIIDRICIMQKSADQSHPWEQIMKYCAFLWCRFFEHNSDHSGSGKLMQIGRDTISEAKGILEIIMQENDMQYQNVIDGKDYTAGSALRFTYR